MSTETRRAHRRPERHQEIKKYPKVLQTFQDTANDQSFTQIRGSLSDNQRVMDHVIRVASTALLLASEYESSPYEVMELIQMHSSVIKEFKFKLKRIVDKDLNESLNQSLNSSANNTIADEIVEVIDTLSEESPRDAADLNTSLSKMENSLELMNVMDEILNRSKEFVELLNESGYSTDSAMRSYEASFLQQSHQG